MRVRTGRFEKLRLRETWYPQTVKVRDRQHPVELSVAITPPAPGICRYALCDLLAGPQFSKLPIYGYAALPVLELDRAEPVPQPFIQRAPDARRLRASPK